MKTSKSATEYRYCCCPSCCRSCKCDQCLFYRFKNPSELLKTNKIIQDAVSKKPKSRSDLKIYLRFVIPAYLCL